MKIEEAFKYIVDNWPKLPHGRAYDYGSNNTPDCVWFIEDDNSGSYEVDIEKIGITEGGRIIWAYASGCSCWDGDYSIHEVHDKNITALELNHENLKETWQEKLIKFVEDHQRTLAK